MFYFLSQKALTNPQMLYCPLFNTESYSVWFIVHCNSQHCFRVSCCLLETDFTEPPPSKSAPNLLSAILVLEQQLSWPLIPQAELKFDSWLSVCGPGELVTGPGTSVEVSVWPWEWAKSPLPRRLLRWRSLLMSLWLIYASGAILSLRQHSSGKLTPVHKGNMCESARRLLSCLVLVFLFIESGHFKRLFPWSNCVSYSESSQEGSKQSCEGSGAAGKRWRLWSANFFEDL